jgi:hypothetical protein
MKPVALLAALMLFVPTVVAAQTKYQEIASVPVGPWKAQSWNNQGKFAHCTLQRIDGDQVTTMARGSAGYVLGLTSPKWKLEPKSAYPVRLVAGSKVDRDARAEVSNENTVTIRLGTDQGLIDQLKDMDALDVRAASGTIRIKLDQGAEALNQLEICWRENTRLAEAETSTNPFAAKPETNTNPFAAKTKGLPEKVSLEDYSRLMTRISGGSAKTKVDKDGDFETSHKGNVKTMFSTQEGSGSIEEIAESFLTGAKSGCKDAPKTGTVSRSDSGSVRVHRVFMACKVEGAPVYIDAVVASDGARFQSHSTVGIQKDQMEIMQISRSIFDEVAKSHN